MPINFIFSSKISYIVFCYINGIYSTDWNKNDLFNCKTNFFYEIMLQFIFNRGKSLGIPINSIHFIHCDNYLMNSKRFHNVGMLFSLPSPYKWWFKVIYIDHKDSVICLSCPSNHIRYKIFMSRWIQKHNLFIIKLNLFNTNIDCYTSIPLFLSWISHPSMLKRLFPNLFRLFFIFMGLLLSNVISFF